MNVLYLHQHFATRAGAGGTRSYEFARRLLARGHGVTMVAQRRRAGGIDRPGRHDVDGIHVRLLGGYYTNHLSPLRRTWQFLRFTVRAATLRGFPERPDVVIASSTPLTIGIPGVLLARRYRVPFVFEVRDLWPEAPIQLGAVRSRLLGGLLRRLERWLYRRADVVITLSPGMEAGALAAGCDPRRLVTIPNASDVELFSPEHRDRSLLDEWDVEDRFVAVHAGSMGAANGLDYLVEAARVLRERGDDRIAIVIVGAGGTEAALRRRVQELGLDNVRFTGSIPRRELGAIVSSCDACVVSFADYPILATNSPNKLFDGLAAGLPIVVNSDGWTRALVEESGAGSWASVREPARLADELQRLAGDPELRERRGAAARRLAEDVFARERLAERFCRVLEHAADASTGTDGADGAGLPRELRTPLVPAAAMIADGAPGVPPGSRQTVADGAGAGGATAVPSP